jgi:hypothetical protein
VEEFKPPDKAKLEDIQKWEDALAASKRRIKGFNGGGALLREFIHSEVRKLELLRHRLFCKYTVVASAS